MNDIAPPPKPRQKPPVNLPEVGGTGRIGPPQKLLDKVELALPEHASELPSQKVRRLGRWLAIGGAVLIVLLIAAAVGMWQWYANALKPVSASEERRHVHIESGATIQIIAATLQQEGVIKSELAFRILAKQTGKIHALQAGEYLLSPSQSSRDILNYIAEGKVDTFNVTIAPGKRLDEIKAGLVKDGFKQADIDAAFAKSYDHPLLAGKPAEASLEGYIFPETYQITSQTTVETLLGRAFDEFYDRIQQEGTLQKLTDRGFNLYQGITLASIVQKEVSDPDVQKQVAQVFEERLRVGMELGSDVTYMYAAAITGQQAATTLDSPYNTRKYKGLPPGPIANFNFAALQAVAQSAPGDYLFFVAGDDGTTHFARTSQEHDENVRKYCTDLCSAP